MKLSIITINRNNAEGLRKTLASVAAQTYCDIEHIIIDGASTDGSVEIIKDFAERMATDKRSPLTVIWSSEPDKGIYNAINKGICKATGEYIQILNSGDRLAAPDVTERMINALISLNAKRPTLNEHPVGILYGNMLRDVESGKLYRDTCRGNIHDKSLLPHEIEWTMNDFICGTINHDPTYIHRDIYAKYGLYDEQLRIVSDWKWFVNVVVLGGEKVYYVPIDVTVFDTTGISETNLIAREAERRAELEKMLPTAVLKDYNRYHFPIEQYKRLKKHHLWPLVCFLERILFKLEKWGITK